MKLRVGKRAQEQAKTIEAWWAEHRPDAPTLFLDELQEIFQRICNAPSSGVRWPTRRRPDMRRILMKRTNNHVYFAIEEATDSVHVHAVWGAPKGRAPSL